MIGVIYKTKAGAYKFYCKRCVRFYLESFTGNRVRNAMVWTVSDKFSALKFKCSICHIAFKCVITSMEHRVREWFKYKEQPVFGPHFDVEALVELCSNGKFVHR